ncbi:MAG: hypothetical protein ACMUJM_07895 [bacterium]
MHNYKFFKAAIIIVIVMSVFALTPGSNVRGQYSIEPWPIIIWPPFDILPAPLAFILLQQTMRPYYFYAYFNSINGTLLGFSTFSPFLPPDITGLYTTTGIPTYPYPSSPYETTFSYTTLPGITFPYAQSEYPTFVYGTPDVYLSWALLQ